MRTLHHTLYYPSRTTRLVFWHITDSHVGAAGCDEAMFKADVESIASNPNAYWGFGGDACECITRTGDKRFRESAIADWLYGVDDIVSEQIDRFISIIKPIAHKCLYFGMGNHEDSMLTHYNRDVYLELCRRVADAKGCEIGDVATGWESFIVLKFRRGTPEAYGGTTSMSLYYHHGAGGGRKLGGHALRLEDTMLRHEADICFLGHRHVRSYDEIVVNGPGRRAHQERRRGGIYGGSYLATHIPPARNGMPRSTYPQTKQLPALTVGMVPIIIKPDTLDWTPITAKNPRLMIEALTA